VLARAGSAGNSAFSAAAMRVAYRSVDDLRALMPQLSDAGVE
jgi:hypothetical protein